MGVSAKVKVANMSTYACSIFSIDIKVFCL